MRLSIATSAEYANFHDDDVPLLEALAERGVRVTPRVWNDPAVDWRTDDAVLVRTIWDYYRDPVGFAAWLDRLDACGARVLNPVPLLRWNADKRYLAELAAQGVPGLASTVVERGTLAQALADAGLEDAVVKPVVSAGAFRTFRVRRTEVAAREEEFAALLSASAALVQPYLAEITAAGEWSLLYAGGRYSHAVLKRPRAGDFRVQEKHGGTLAVAEPPEALIAQGLEALAPVAMRFGMPCYARVDGVVVDGRLWLMELELIEPQLFLTGVAGAGERFAEAVLTTLRS